MNCPKCGKTIARMVQKEDGLVLTPCCDGISEIGPRRVNYASPATKQKVRRKNERFAKDTSQKWKDKTTPAGWQVVQDFIRTHKNEPERLGGYGEKRLRESGVVSERRISQARELRRRELVADREAIST